MSEFLWPWDVDSVLFVIDCVGVWAAWHLNDHVQSRSGKVLLGSLMLVFGYLAVSDVASINNEAPPYLFRFPLRGMLWRGILVTGMLWCIWIKRQRGLDVHDKVF